MFLPLLSRCIQRLAARTVQISTIAVHEIQNPVLTKDGIGRFTESEKRIRPLEGHKLVLNLIANESRGPN
ncbi:MAG: hypothetical protein F4058_04340 [Rhodothermaceae bacterium]|nr:hypothetical protein [Rhodothermaceae bacterium]